jgi:hypothetical protein
LEDLKTTSSFLDKNPDFLFENHFSNFLSFKSKRMNLESQTHIDEPDLNKYFNAIEDSGSKSYRSKIPDSVFERIVNSDGHFIIGNDLYQIKNNQLFKKDLLLEDKSPTFVSKVVSEVEKIASAKGVKNARVDGLQEFSCGGSTYRLVGELANFNIGIYQRLSIQVKHQRRNTSFWSWLDPWVAENVSFLKYSAVLNLQPAGWPAFTVSFSDNCTNCWQFDRTIDINIGAAGPTQWSNNYGNFEANTLCGYKILNF